MSLTWQFELDMPASVKGAEPTFAVVQNAANEQTGLVAFKPTDSSDFHYPATVDIGSATKQKFADMGNISSTVSVAFNLLVQMQYKEGANNLAGQWFPSALSMKYIGTVSAYTQTTLPSTLSSNTDRANLIVIGAEDNFPEKRSEAGFNYNNLIMYICYSSAFTAPATVGNIATYKDSAIAQPANR